MRWIKFSIIGAIVLFVLLTCIGLLMPSSVTVIRSVKLDAPVDSVRFYVNNIANWRYWINGADTAYFKQITNSATGKNAKIKLANYTVTILENDANHIVTLWVSNNNYEQTSRLDLYADNSGININWSFRQKLNWYFWQRLRGMLYDKVFGPQMEASLAKLKQLCEK